MPLRISPQGDLPGVVGRGEAIGEQRQLRMQMGQAKGDCHRTGEATIKKDDQKRAKGSSRLIASVLAPGLCPTIFARLQLWRKDRGAKRGARSPSGVWWLTPARSPSWLRGSSWKAREPMRQA